MPESTFFGRGVKMRAVATMLCSLGVMMLLGCGGGGGSLDTVPISGVVTLDGTPVEGANVVFAPTSGDGSAASGVTDSSGRYQLTTQDPNDGALPGSYMVMISKSTVGQDATTEAVKPGMSSEEATKAAMEAFEAGGQAEPEFVDELPAKYKNPSTSGFTADVAKGGQTEFDFALTSE
jgi:hypothetical protein